MLLPFRRRPTQAKSLSTSWTPGKPAELQHDHVADARPHLDYNLHPLNVERLEHYIESPLNNEPFKVH
jgi:hypothetical protein